jgi:hypothetical protein
MRLEAALCLALLRRLFGLTMRGAPRGAYRHSSVEHSASSAVCAAPGVSAGERSSRPSARLNMAAPPLAARIPSLPRRAALVDEGQRGDEEGHGEPHAGHHSFT